MRGASSCSTTGSASGSSDVEITGAPAHQDIDLSGGSDVVRR